MPDVSASLPSATKQNTATIAGLGAIALWSALAALTVLAGKIPPFELTAIAFAGGTVVGLVYAVASGQSLAAMRNVPPAAWVLGIGGLLGYHACYFMALRIAPPLEASLICYLWPLLMILMAGALPVHAGGKPLRWQHIAGAVLGFAGTTLILFQGHGRLDFDGALVGYLLAFAAAVIWSSYSVASRLFRRVPSIAVIGSCAGTMIGAAAMHASLETWVWPQSATQWFAIIALGAGPLGLAFYLWDQAMKHGDLLRLGLASYATPLLSTLILATLGLGVLSPMLAAAAVLVTLGAVVAGRAS